MAKYTVTYYIKSGGREHECDMQVEADNAAEACKLSLRAWHGGSTTAA